jgi:hypothetical protein
VTDFPIEFFEGHIIMDAAGLKVLVDTGAPKTIGRVETWEFLGLPFSLRSNYLTLKIEDLSDLVGTDIDILLGVDILARQPFLIDTKAAVIAFELCPDAHPDAQNALNAVMGIPSTSVLLDGRQLPVFIDTGAKFSYLYSAIADDYPAEGREEDFYPGFGRFETEVRRVEIGLGGQSVTLKFGVLPDKLERVLLLAGPRGIIGTELLKSYRICIDMPAGQMEMWRHAG